MKFTKKIRDINEKKHCLQSEGVLRRKIVTKREYIFKKFARFQRKSCIYQVDWQLTRIWILEFVTKINSWEGWINKNIDWFKLFLSCSFIVFSLEKPKRHFTHQKSSLRNYIPKGVIEKRPMMFNCLYNTWWYIITSLKNSPSYINYMLDNHFYRFEVL